MPAKRSQRDKQAGRCLELLWGDRGEIVFPDRGARPLKIFILTYQHRPRDGHGSHRNGRHKLG